MNSLSIDWIIGGPLLVGLLVVSWWATAQSHEQLADPDDDRTVFLNELSLKLMLFSRGIFRVTVIRQSGNVHAERIVKGTAQDALRIALGTFRRAGIDAVHVIKNDETELQFSRLYHSHRGSKEGKKVGQALDILAFTPKKAALIIRKALESAIANAEHNDGADIDELKVKTILVEQGATLKRFSARAKGRGNRISKPTCHIFVTVGN